MPRRPDPIGANATLQYAVLSSTTLAGAYTAVAANYRQRVNPQLPVSRTALFIRSSAKLGVCAGALGAAVNWYYYSGFASVVVSQQVPDTKPWKLYTWTKSRTVEDGCLAGAAFGLAASIPTLLMRRPAIPRWTRCFGMAQIGAYSGVLVAHGYLQYTGKRQEAYKHLDRQLKRRSLGFWNIYWDKNLMAQLNPIMQMYVRHNGLWYTQLLPVEAYEESEHNSGQMVMSIISDKNVSTPTSTEQKVEEPPYYTQAFDYAETLKDIDVDSTLQEMQRLEQDRANYLAEAEYLLFLNAQKAHEYCHLNATLDDDERRHRLEELHMLELSYDRLRGFASAIDTQLVRWRLALQHKALFDAKAPYGDAVADWFPTPELMDFEKHRPDQSIVELRALQVHIVNDIRRFTWLVEDTRYEQGMRDRWRRDLDYGRVILRVIDQIVVELERTAAARTVVVGGTAGGEEKSKQDVAQNVKTVEANTPDRNEEVAHENGAQGDTLAAKDKVPKLQNGGLERDKPQ